MYVQDIGFTCTTCPCPPSIPQLIQLIMIKAKIKAVTKG